jgi:hypothetical protein
MAKIIIGRKQYSGEAYDNEVEIENFVVKNSNMLFGPRTVYFDLKKGIKAQKEGILSIPDGYLLSFMSGEPKLYVVENELASHDVYKHIGVHFLKYNSAFSEGSKIKVKNFLLDYVKNHSEVRKQVNELIAGSRFANASELLDYVIFESDYGFLVVIDKVTEELRLVLKSFNPEILEIKKFASDNTPKDRIYLFDGFQEEVTESIGKSIRELSEVDTVVCPAKEEGFEEVFKKQNRWYAIRISPSMLPQIKYIAMYEVAPISAIRWIGEVEKIEPCVRPGYEDVNKYEVILRSKEKLKNPVKLIGKGTGKVPQGPRYSKMSIIKSAKSIEDIF